MINPYCHMTREALQRLTSGRLVEIKNAPRFYDETRNDAAAILERRGHPEYLAKLDRLARKNR